MKPKRKKPGSKFNPFASPLVGVKIPGIGTLMMRESNYEMSEQAMRSAGADMDFWARGVAKDYRKNGVADWHVAWLLDKNPKPTRRKK